MATQLIMASYYQEFDDETSDGKVFTDDLSAEDVDVNKLTQAELTSRTEYIDKLNTLYQTYKNKDRHPVATTQEEVLQQRIVAPSLSCSNISKRSTKLESRASTRTYPQIIHVWDNFRAEVENYTTHDTRILNIDQIFIISLTNARTPCRKEASEQERLIQNLDLTLRQAGIVDSVGEEPKPEELVGQIDFWLTNETKKISIICECKTTHNLLLPLKAVDCKSAYDNAFAHWKSTEQRSIEWSNVAHPIGQLLCYMVDNKHRYGALTSGTRTYFIVIKGSYAAKTRNGKMKVHISDGWFVGEANYLRAWAFMHQLHKSDHQPPWTDPLDWYKTSKIDEIFTPDMKQISQYSSNNTEDSISKVRSKKISKKRGRDDSSGKQLSRCSTPATNTYCNMDCFLPLHQGALDYVPYNDIVIVGVLGEGRNGSCFKVKWKGTECAMKQFDIGRNGDEYFENELRAYLLLQKAWGNLVPRPLFLSESFSGGVMFLGLQLGREPTYSENEMEQFRNVLKLIETEYGIRHNDAERGRNMIILTDENNGVDRVAAIDFEDWDAVKK